MKYIAYGRRDGITVGLLEESKEELDLAQNTFNLNVNNSLHCGCIDFVSLKQFERFLTYKYYLSYCNAKMKCNLTKYRMIRAAITKAKETIDSNVRFN